MMKSPNMLLDSDSICITKLWLSKIREQGRPLGRMFRSLVAQALNNILITVENTPPTQTVPVEEFAAGSKTLKALGTE